MAIRSLQFQDLDSGWSLETLRLEPLNLLVGISGAGKTQILHGLEHIRKAGLSGAGSLSSARWDVSFEVDGEIYRWQAENRTCFYDIDRVHSSEPSTDGRFLHERSTRDDVVLVERNNGDFRFEGHDLPRLNESESSIQLLTEEDSMAPLHKGLELWKSFQVGDTAGELTGRSPGVLSGAEKDRRNLGGDLEHLKRRSDLPPLRKLYILERDHHEVFRNVVADFIDVFPTVKDVTVTTLMDLSFSPNLGEDYMNRTLAAAFKEQGAKGWIVDAFWSSGMRKTLDFIIETELAAKDTVFLIDELENGLGVNCLPHVAGRMLEGLDRIQFIATSHHPRVINEIPVHRWKVVTRNGSTVRVLDAEDIPSLNQASPLDKFTALINAPEYEEGIA